MTDMAKGILDKGKPWRTDVRWEIVAIETVIAVVVGAFILINPDSARDGILQIVGVALLFASLHLGAMAMRGNESAISLIDAFRGGVGVTIGVIATSSWWSDYIENPAVRVILGWGLVAFAVLQLVGLFTAQGRAAFSMTSLMISALILVLGIILLTSDNATADSRMTMLGVTFLVFGVLLGGLAYLLYARHNGAKTQVSQ